MALGVRIVSASVGTLRTTKKRRGGRFAGAVLTVAVMMVLAGGTQVGAAQAAAGVRVQTFVSGLPDVPPPSFFAGVGPVGLAFNRAHQLLVSDAANSGFYSFGPFGSTAPTPISTGNVQTGLAFGNYGQLFAALYQAGDIDQIDPDTGAFLRQLNPPATSYPCVIGLAADPISGDLFFGQTDSGGACPGSPGLTRVENPDSAHPTFVTYTSAPGIDYVELTFAPDGTLYAVQQGPTGACAVRISGTRSPNPPTVTTIACFPNFGEFIGIQAIAVSSSPFGGSGGSRPLSHSSPLLFVAGPTGTISEIDQATTPATVSPVVTLATRVDGMIVGPDCALYATQSTGIDRITTPWGACCQFHRRPGRPGRPADR